MEQRLQAINHFTVGRTAYFAYADTATPFRELDEWLRRRLRQVRWKEWKRYHNRRRNLRTLSPAPPDCTELRAARAWEVSPEPLSGVSRMPSALGMRGARRGYEHGAGVPAIGWVESVRVRLFEARTVNLSGSGGRLYAQPGMGRRLAMLSILVVSVGAVVTGCGDGGNRASLTTADAAARSLLAFSAVRHFNRDVFVLEVPGGTPKPLTEAIGEDISPSWSPDARSLVFVSDRAGAFDIWRTRPDGSGTKRLTLSAGDDGAPEWSPDGRRIVYWSVRATNADLYTMRPDGSGKKQLTSEPSNDLEPQWSPDSRRVAFVRICTAQWCYPTSSDGAGEIYVVGAGGGRQRRLTRSRAADSDPQWSPDGRRIAFVSTQGKKSHIWLVDPDGSGLIQLTRNSAPDSDPQWSPDGRRVAFVRERGGSGEVYVMNADGSGQRDLTRNHADDSAPRWSADGRLIFFVSDRQSKGEIFAMNADGTGVTLVAKVDAADGDLTVTGTR